MDNERIGIAPVLTNVEEEDEYYSSGYHQYGSYSDCLRYTWDCDDYYYHTNWNLAWYWWVVIGVGVFIIVLISGIIWWCKKYR